LTAYVDVSKQFLIQDSNDAETMLKRDIINALSSKLESTILGSAAGSSTQPSGIFYNGASTYNGALTYGNFVSMEADIEGANIVNEPVYIMHPSAKALCRKTSIDSGSGRFVMENGEISGLPVLITSNVASGLQTAADEYGIILGDFSDYIIGQWGGIDLTIDPYTQATAGKVRLVINAYFDAKPRRNSSFVTASIK
jgi:HK97 family phage major capsid protein